ncbi:MAG: hypothetical protein AB2A00_27200 [Myxococcota bacterium]
MSSLPVALLLTVLSQAPETPAQKPTLLVLPLEARHGVPAQQIQVMTDYMAAESRRIPGYQVVTQADIQQLLSQEVRNQLLGCNDQSCLADIGGALNADEILFGSVGRLGRKELVLSLTRLDARAGKPLAGEAERLKSTDADVLLDGVPRILKRLYPKYDPPAPRVKPPSPLLVGAFMTLVAGALQYSAFLSIFGSNFLAGCFPLQQAVFYGSIVLFLLGPIYTSWLQAYLADLIGRRQGGTLRATLVGILLQPVVGLLTGGSVLFFGILGSAVTVTSHVVSFLGSESFQRITRGEVDNPQVQADLLQRVVWAVLSTTLATGFGVSVGVLPGILAMTLCVPATQATAILWGAGVRSPDEDAALPGLFGSDQELPGPLQMLPRWIVGGKREEDALEEPPPAPSPAPAATPPAAPSTPPAAQATPPAAPSTPPASPEPATPQP